MIKQIVGGLVLAVLAAGSVCGVVYGCKYNDLNNSNLSAIEENVELHSSIDELNELVDSLMNSNEKLSAKVKELEIQGVSKDATIEDLNTQISTVQSQLENLQFELARVNQENEDYIMQISLYETQIQNLNNEITRLSGLLEAYEDIASETFAVSFFVEEQNLNLATTAVKNNQCISELPENSNSSLYRIDGWKLEDGTSVDPLTYPITTSTTFYADISYRYDISIPLPSGGSSGSTDYAKADVFTFPNVNNLETTYADYAFQGWYDSKDPNVLYQPGDSYPYFNTNTVRPIFIPLFTYDVSVSFIFGEEVVKTSILECVINKSVYLTDDMIPSSYHGYSIESFSLEDGTVIDCLNYGFSVDTSIFIQPTSSAVSINVTREELDACRFEYKTLYMVDIGAIVEVLDCTYNPQTGDVMLFGKGVTSGRVDCLTYVKFATSTFLEDTSFTSLAANRVDNVCVTEEFTSYYIPAEDGSISGGAVSSENLLNVYESSDNFLALYFDVKPAATDGYCTLHTYGLVINKSDDVVEYSFVEIETLGSFLEEQLENKKRNSAYTLYSRYFED